MDTATTEIYTLSLHDALPIYNDHVWTRDDRYVMFSTNQGEQPFLYDIQKDPGMHNNLAASEPNRSEEHTSELQSRQYLVCRLLLEKNQRTYPRLPKPAVYVVA